jgi:hypothetical protein
MMGQVQVFLFVALVLVLVGVGHWLAAQRRKALAQWAASRGLSFDSRKDSGFSYAYPDFECLNRGRNQYAYNVCSGQLEGGWRVSTFDYHYVTGSGKHRHTHRFSGVVVDSPIALKRLTIRPEGLFDKVTDFFGFGDIDFESAEFSKAFHVKSSDRRWAYDVIHTRAMELLLRSQRFSVQFGSRSVMAWRDSRLGVGDLDQAIGVARGLLEGLPDYVVRQQIEGGA